MQLGPIELIVLAFPGSHFNGEVRPRIKDLVDRGIVNVIDAVFVQKTDDGKVVIQEFDQLVDDAEMAALAASLTLQVDLISGEDLEELTAELAPGDSALALAFEHAWVKPFGEAVTASGGVLLADIQVPGADVENVLAALSSG